MEYDEIFQFDSCHDSPVVGFEIDEKIDTNKIIELLKETFGIDDEKSDLGK